MGEARFLVTPSRPLPAVVYGNTTVARMTMEGQMIFPGGFWVDAQHIPDFIASLAALAGLTEGEK